MKQLILGTAGHIDHGKTALVKLLTGTDTDRLKEEKQRGITIELGFASLDIPDGTHLGIVDVPGHEKFVRTMVAGAGGVDMVCLVIAADEGIMPQTTEHFDICRLLGIERGLIALTKADLVDADWIDLVEEELAQFVEGTFLEGAPVVRVSSVTGQGKPELIDALQTLAQTVQARKQTDIFRLPVDRVFTMKGFGTVLTGSGVGGTVRVGETVEILPSGLRAKVRGLQVHNESVEQAGAGLRTAVNLQGIEKQQVTRGQVLVKPGTLQTTYLLDARIDLLPHTPKPLAHRTRVRFDHLTEEILARVVPLSDEPIQPGQSGAVQLRLEAPAVVLPGDRFVLRGYSPVATLGGGTVLHPCPAKHRRPFADALFDLEILESGALSERMLLMYKGVGKAGLPFSSLNALLGATEKELLGVYRDLTAKGQIVRFDQEENSAISQETYEKVTGAVLAYLEKYHQDRPTQEGISRQELASKVEWGVPIKLLARVLTGLEKNNQVKRSDDLVSLYGHKASLKGGLETLGKTYLSALEMGGSSPPTFKELVALADGDKTAARQVLDLLTNDKKIVRISADLYYEAGALNSIVEKLRDYLKEHEQIDAGGFKELSGTSRKYSIPLLEYFDAARITIRVGDKRVARKTS